MTVAERLAAWACELQLEDVPELARHACVRHLLDGVGNALGAARLGEGKPAVTVAEGLGGPPEARMLTGGEPLAAPAVAFADGVLVHALDFDDTHARGLVHPTAVVLPAAFAVGQQVGASGGEVLTAAAAGYEVMCRLGAAAPHGFHARGLHATGVCGPLAAAVVAGLLLDLEQEALVRAIGIAGSSAGGLLEFLDTGADTKTLHPGLAAQSGVLAARLAAAGAAGPASVVEGRRGLYAALAREGAEPDTVTEALGERWEVTQITLKPYPACQLMHAALDAAVGLRRKLDAEIVAIEVDLHADAAEIVSAPAAAKARPRTPYEAKFSLPWSLAALLCDGEVTVESYTEDRLSRPELLALARRVRSTSFTSRAAAADAPARVTVRTAAGDTLRGEAPGSRGGPARPLSDAELEAKLAGNVGTTRAAGELAHHVLHLAEQPSLEELHRLSAESLRAPLP